MKRVVVVGGGFAGVHLIRALEHRLPENAVTMKWLADGEAVRKRVIRAFEDAAIESDAAKRKQDLTFVLIGAGPVGVELASSLRDLMDHTLRRIYPTVDFERDVTIHLLDAADRVLPSFDPRLGRIAMKRLEQQKIRVLLKAAVSEIRPGLVRTKEGAELSARSRTCTGAKATSSRSAARTRELSSRSCAGAS